MQNRATIRQELRHKRRSLSADLQQQHAIDAMKHFIKHPLFTQANHIAFYLATDGELSPEPLLQHAASLQKECYLPIMHPTKEHEILFMPYQPGDVLIHNCFNILEPPLTDDVIMPWELDLVLTPLVAFDEDGNRLGVGAGCYDRSFAFLKQKIKKTIHLIGMAHELQNQPQLEPAPWDIPLNGILTESTLRLF